MKKYFLFAILFAVFIISVVLRSKQITPIVKTHEQTYILTLQTCEIWNKQGIAKCHFTPMWTYNNPGDKKMAYYKRLEDDNGNNYYVSFPPLSFMLAYLILKPFDYDYGKLILQIFNLIAHFFSACIIYLIVCQLFKQEINKFSFPGFTAFLIYLFLPVMLFLHSDIFFPEMIGQVLWILVTYILFRLKENANNRQYILFFVSMFLFVYTEWIAVFYIFSLILYLSFTRNFSNRKKLIFLSLIALVSGAITITLQYASIAGFGNLFHAMGIRFLERSGFFGQKYSSMGVHIFSFESLKLFYLNIHKTLGITGYILVLLFLILIVKKRKLFTQTSVLIAVTIALPLLLHCLVFFNANALHLMLMARITFPLSLIGGILVYYYFRKYHEYKKSVFIPIVLYFVFLIYSLFSYKNEFIFNEEYPQLIEVARLIKEKSNSQQAVFIIADNKIPEPEKFLTYMTKRNIIRVSDKYQCLEYLKNNNLKHEAIVFDIGAAQDDEIISYNVIVNN